MSAYIKALQSAFNSGTEEGERFGMQLMADLVTLALNQEFGFGPERLERFMVKVDELRDRYHFAVTQVKNPECDYYRNEMDTLLKACVPPNRYAPFEERYPQLKDVRYK